MNILETYRGYTIYRPRGYKKRIFVDGPGISCHQWWLNIDSARGHIDFVIKYIIKKRNWK